MSQPITPDQLRELARQAGGGIHTGAAAASDIDAAYDTVIDTAGERYGFTGDVPSLASTSASDVTALDLPPATAIAAARAVVTAAATGTPGLLYAAPIAPSSAFTRRRVRAIATTGEHHPTSLLLDPSDLLSTLADTPDADGALPEPGETLDAATVKVTSRHRPIATAHKGPAGREFVVIDTDTDTLVSRGHATASEARRAAVTLLRELPKDDLTRPTLHVVKLAARADAPLVSVHRERLATKVTAALVWATPKNPDTLRTVGWVFAGTRP